jgi:hypothetical protein
LYRLPSWTEGEREGKLSFHIFFKRFFKKKKKKGFLRWAKVDEMRPEEDRLHDCG